jgi:hypothetical protein
MRRYNEMLWVLQASRNCKARTKMIQPPNVLQTAQYKIITDLYVGETYARLEAAMILELHSPHWTFPEKSNEDAQHRNNHYSIAQVMNHWQLEIILDPHPRLNTIAPIRRCHKEIGYIMHPPGVPVIPHPFHQRCYTCRPQRANV